MTAIRVLHPRVEIFHPESNSFAVLLFNQYGEADGGCVFKGTRERQEELAYEYAEFKKQQFTNGSLLRS